MTTESITVEKIINEVNVTTGPTSLATLTDVTLTNITNGDMLYYSSGAFINGNPAAIRSNLSLGSMALQASSAITVTGGSLTGVTINDSAIGGSTPSSGAFTTLSTTGTFSANDQVIEKPVLKDYAETRTTPSSSSNIIDLDLENGNVFEVTLTENVTTTTFSNPSITGSGCSFTLILKQDGVGGWSFAWPASVEWTDSTAPTLITTANSKSILTFVTTDAGTTWYGFLAGSDMG